MGEICSLQRLKIWYRKAQRPIEHPEDVFKGLAIPIPHQIAMASASTRSLISGLRLRRRTRSTLW
jgi:hypothetical protein